jgi:hypothetical protein
MKYVLLINTLDIRQNAHFYPGRVSLTLALPKHFMATEFEF